VLLTVLYFGSAYEKRGGVGIIHLFAGNQRIASVRPDGTTQFYHPDHLGSSWIITDGSGAIKEKNEFHPFGTYHEAIDFDSSFPDVNYTFTGQEEDDEVGLYNYNARLYDPELGRFISPDSIVPDPGDLQALNRYSYCLNNPLIYVDPSGNFFIFDDIIVAISSFLVNSLGVSAGFTAYSVAATFTYGTVSALGGATLGAMQSAATGGNIGMGALTGAITGAIFYGAGNIIGGLGLGAGPTVTLGEQAAIAGIHAGAGMISGGISSAITGGNIGLGMLTGGISGGIGSFAGGFLPKDFGSQLIGRSLIGGITGGITAEIAGAEFWEGFAQGAFTSAAGFLFNYMLHKPPEGAKTFPWLKQKAIPGQLAKDVLLPGAVIVEGGIATGVGVALAPEITALTVQSGTIYVLGNANTYRFIVDFMLGVSPTPPSSLGGYAGTATKTFVIDPIKDYLLKCH